MKIKFWAFKGTRLRCPHGTSLLALLIGNMLAQAFFSLLSCLFQLITTAAWHFPDTTPVLQESLPYFHPAAMADWDPTSLSQCLSVEWIIQLWASRAAIPVLCAQQCDAHPAAHPIPSQGSALPFPGPSWCWKALAAKEQCGCELKFKRDRRARLLCVLEERWARAVNSELGFLKFKFWFIPVSPLKDDLLLYKSTFYHCPHFSFYCVI